MLTLGRQRRIGTAILRVLAEHALEAVPVVGPYVRITFEVAVAVAQEVGKEEGQAVSKEEAAAALRSLTLEERKQVVDAVLESPKGAQAITHLSGTELQAVRKRLVNLPSEFDGILAGIEEDDRREAERAARQAREQAEASRRYGEERAALLKERLKSELERKDFEQAYKTADTILIHAPGDKGTLTVQRWLEKRLRRGILRDTLIGGAIGFGFLMSLGLVELVTGNKIRMSCEFALGFVVFCALVGLVVGAARRSWRWLKIKT